MKQWHVLCAQQAFLIRPKILISNHSFVLWYFWRAMALPFSFCNKGKDGCMHQIGQAAQTTQRRWSEFAMPFVTAHTEVTAKLKLAAHLKNDVSLTGYAYFGCIHPSRLKGPESHRWTRDKHKNLHICKHSEGKLMHFEQAWREWGLHNCLLPRSWMLPELKMRSSFPSILVPDTFCLLFALKRKNDL